MAPLSVYVHIPFCIHRCAYCDFNTYAGLQHLVPDYVKALCVEIRLAVRAAGKCLPAHTIFFGGGTPSLLPLELVEGILSTLQASFDLAADIEVTLEANPGTLAADYLIGLRELGVNRLSLGMQSANPRELGLLERQHDFGDVVQAVTWARRAGFDNLSLDLIFGLPGQSLESWQNNLKLAAGLDPEHLSLYALTLEHGTPMQHWVARGLLNEPDSDLAADQYEWSGAFLKEAGFVQYEISNWARQAEDGQIRACRHNLQYWRGLPYLGFGAGAHGYAHDVRVANVLGPAAYIQKLTEPTEWVPSQNTNYPITPATVSAIHSQGRDAMGEFMMMGLRLTLEGISRSTFRERFEIELDDIYGQEIDRLVRQGLLERQADTLRLTPHGRLLGNRVFMEFIDG